MGGMREEVSGPRNPAMHVTLRAFFAIVEQSAATTPANVNSSAADFGFQRVMYGHRERLLRPW
jgi:hypothetical protein